MPQDEARSLLQHLEDRIKASEIEVGHRDVLIRLRALIEEDLEPADGSPARAASDQIETNRAG